MSFRVSFLFFLYAASFWAFGTMALFVELHTPAIFGFLLAMLLAMTHKRLGINIPNRIWFVMSLFVLGMALYAWFVLLEQLYAVVYTFLYLQWNKLWTGRKNRDYLQVFGLTFFQMIAAAVSTASLLFAPALIVYLFLILGALISVTMKRDAELVFRRPAVAGSPISGNREADRNRLRQFAMSKFMDRQMFFTLNAALVGILLIGSGLFYIIPRLQAQSFVAGLTAPVTQAKSGFNDSVDFMAMGEIQTDNSIVARAIPEVGYRTENYPVYDLLRLRGTALDYYNGRGWMKSAEVRSQIRQTGKSMSFEMGVPSIHRSMGNHTQTVIHLEPNRSGYLFSPGWPTQIYFDSPYSLIRDEVSDSTQLSINRWTTTLSYKVHSIMSVDQPPTSLDQIKERLDQHSVEADEVNYLPERLLHRILNSRTSESIRRAFRMRTNLNRYYLQIPDHPDMEIIRRLAEEWTEGSASEYETARMIERRLKTRFGYSLDTSFAEREDHLTAFLTDVREGHCEYFATSMVMMLRAKGIPARIVNGYATDEWVETSGTGYFLVRNAHAHSWVEAHIPEAGWLTFDPTPLSGLGHNRILSSFYLLFSRWYDSMKFIWYDSVIDYDANDQSFLYAAVFRGLDIVDLTVGALLQGGRNGVNFEQMPLPRKILLVVTGLCLLVIGGLLTREFAKGIRRRIRARATLVTSGALNTVVIEDYLELLTQAEKLQERNPAQTPLEFAQAVAQNGHRESLADFPMLTEDYYNARYHGAPWTREHNKRVYTLLQKLKS